MQIKYSLRTSSPGFANVDAIRDRPCETPFVVIKESACAMLDKEEEKTSSHNLNVSYYVG